MMKFEPVTALLAVLLSILLAGCSRHDEYPNRPITLICPWAAGGGTDRVSRQMATHLEHELGYPVNVINATGGKGVTGHSRGLRARPDGYTIAMITLELNMMHWSGLTNLTFADCQPLMSINEDYCALLVRGDSPWTTLKQLENEIRANPGKLKASGTSTGGAWHLGLAGWLTAINLNAEDVGWISSTGAGPSLQGLLSKNWDMVACSLPEAATLIESGQVRALGVMAPERAKGYPDVPSFIELGTNWTLGGWRGLAVPNGTPQPVVDRLVQAIDRVVSGQTSVAGTTFPEFMDQQGFDNTARPSDEFRHFMQEADAKFGKLLTSDAMRSVNSDPFNPMSFPYIVLALLAMSLTGLAIQRVAIGNKLAADPDDTNESTTIRGLLNLGLIVVAMVAYLLSAETVGFVMVSGTLLLVLLCCLGTRFWVSAVVTLLFVPLVYQLFGGFLRVPLPRGWFGW